MLARHRPDLPLEGVWPFQEPWGRWQLEADQEEMSQATVILKELSSLIPQPGVSIGDCGANQVNSKRPGQAV